MKIALVVMSILPLLLFSSNVCKIDSEVMPNWVCNPHPNTEKSLAGLGVGSSYNQAIVFALCEINNQYDVDIVTSKKDGRDTSIQKSDHYFNEDVFVSSVFKRYKYPSKTNPDNEVRSQKCRVAIQDGDKRLFIQEKVKESKKGLKMSSQYEMQGDTDLEEILKTKGIILTHKTLSEEDEFYVVLEVKKTQLKGK